LEFGIRKPFTAKENVAKKERVDKPDIVIVMDQKLNDIGKTKRK
jgi:hypothetical protein